MDNMNNLRDLLRHDVRDLYSAEEQIIDALPAMIDKANHPALKQALQNHLNVTQNQKARLEQVRQMLGDSDAESDDSGIFAGLFDTGAKCKGMEGIIDEAQKMMKADMSPDVMDAAIAAGAQKVEHYEICGYGTARTYAQQLGLTEVAQLLEQTLDEEHEADEMLTSLAVGGLNQQAENSTSTYRSDSTPSGTNMSGTGTSYR